MDITSCRNGKWLRKEVKVMKPLVTVVIPTTPDRVLLLLKAHETVIKQTYGNIEVIIINDDKITAPQARNRGWMAAHGKYVAFLDDDDEWHPEKIEKQVEYMEDNDNCALCITGSLDRRFNQTRVCMPKEYPTHRDVIKSFNLSSTSSYMVRRHNGLTLFNLNLPASQEYDLAIVLSKHCGHIKCIQEILMFQNATKGQISTSWMKKIKGVLWMARLHGKEYTIIDKVKTIGLLCVFASGFIFGTRIYKVLNKFKEIYENEI